MECQRRSEDLKRKCQQQLAKEADPVERFKIRLLKIGFQGLKNIARKFRVGDRNKDRKISKEEFKWICGTLNITMPEEEFTALFCRFDRDGSGFLDYEEFLFAVRPSMNEPRKILVKQAFAKMDKTGDGVISLDDIVGTYDFSKHPKYQNGEFTKTQVFREFLKSFDMDDHSKDSKDEEPIIVTLEEWMDYYAGVSVSIDEDAYFNLMMRNAWRLDK